LHETTIEEILEAQSGNQEMLNDIVENNSRLIWSIVKRFKNNKYETDDLFQIGAMGLVKSIKRFDNQYNVKLSTFAVPYIIGEIKKYLRDDGMVKVSRSLKELNIKIEMLRKQYEKLGKELSINEIEKELKESKENILLALEANKEIKSIDEEFEDSNENILFNKVKVESYEEDTIKKIILKQELEKLDEKERNIIILRYFYNKTQSQIASQYGISQVQVSRIEKRVLLKMRENIKEKM
jgi:RNA polymerase sporulation-specific sigma factor